MNKHLKPHDRLFRSMMSDLDVARDFFEQYLPARIRSIVDLSSIKVQKDSFIDDRLRMQISDMLYTTKFNQRLGYIYTLIEHQSQPDPLMPFRVLKYVIAIMEKHMENTKSKQLPIVYPIVFYTGRSEYKYSMDIFDLFGEQKKLAQDVLLSPYQLIDLFKIDDEYLEYPLLLGVMERMMKHIYSKDIVPFLKIIMRDLQKIEKLGVRGAKHLYTMLSYLVEAGEADNKEEFINTIKTGLTSIEGEKLMTIAEQFRQEGRQEGIIKERQIIASRLIQQGMDISKIMSITGLSQQEISALEQK